MKDVENVGDRRFWEWWWWRHHNGSRSRLFLQQWLQLSNFDDTAITACQFYPHYPLQQPKTLSHSINITPQTQLSLLPLLPPFSLLQIFQESVTTIIAMDPSFNHWDNHFDWKKGLVVVQLSCIYSVFKIFKIIFNKSFSMADNILNRYVCPIKFIIQLSSHVFCPHSCH